MDSFSDRIGRRGAVLVVLALVAGCGGGGSSSPAPSTPTPTTAPLSAFSCPTSQTNPESGTSHTVGTESVRIGVRIPAPAATAAPALLAVVSTSGRSPQAMAAGETAAGATFLHQFVLSATGRTVRVVAVAPGQAAAATAALRAQAGVVAVGPADVREHAFTVAPSWPNDPYFNGFATTLAPSPGATTPPATYHVAPYEESPSVPGQWDMHAIGLEYAFGYAVPGNGSGITNTGAAGSSTVKIAVIDTGADAGHPELQSKIAYQRCFITNTSNVQSTGVYATDPDGHGTNVAGIAAAATNNGLGFAGAGGATSIYAYRVFPTPDDACFTPSNSGNDPRCEAESGDIAAAVDDAIAQHVNVISLSLGAGSCVGGQDPDPGEGAAIAEAIAQHIVVVAASGNSGSSSPGVVSAPACDTGVIAVGASALTDGTPNLSGRVGGTPAAPLEYVASYSQYGATGAQPKNPAAWGIVAPGGDPLSGDPDEFHWIEGPWTTTPIDSTFAATCNGDYPAHTGTDDCRALVAGTSQATPHVAGAAALILAVAPAYQSATLMKTLLCQTADDINDPHEGCGRLNVYRAMAVALGDPSPP